MLSSTRNKDFKYFQSEVQQLQIKIFVLRQTLRHKIGVKDLILQKTHYILYAQYSALFKLTDSWHIFLWTPLNTFHDTHWLLKIARNQVRIREILIGTAYAGGIACFPGNV